jgi:hypothetical protein
VNGVVIITTKGEQVGEAVDRGRSSRSTCSVARRAAKRYELLNWLSCAAVNEYRTTTTIGDLQ